MDKPATLRKINRLIESVTKLRNQCLSFEKAHASAVAAAAPGYRRSARNLLHYLALRQHDLRDLQEDLSSLGLSSLGRLEAHSLATLNAVLKTLHKLAGRPAPDLAANDAPVDFVTGPKTLREHTNQLLGPEPVRNPVRVMVTMPTEAADDPAVIRDLLGAGMNVMRINCAHDGPDAWKAMVANLHRAERELGRSCRVLADLSGPKLRTGEVAPRERVVKFSPRRDHAGVVLTPVRIWLTPADKPADAPLGATGQLLVLDDFLSDVRPGDTIEIEESRGRHRDLHVTDVGDGSCWAECDRTLYVAEGAGLTLSNEDGHHVAEGRVGSVPPVLQPIVLYRGDTLVLTRGVEPGRAAVFDGNGAVVAPARISCSLDAVFRSVRPGAQVWMDDGTIGGIIRTVSENEIGVEITYARPNGSKLRGEKGINLPDTTLDVPALSEKDFADLDAVFPLIDMVGLSFLQRPEDLFALERRLEALEGQDRGVVMKIENRVAFEHLPELLLAALRSPPVGVMVARGDLAVEVGFDRLAEVQEEILWLCEAAHVPVIWATQVLEELTKTGRPSRSEVTDAAMSGRAECVMLNKGPFITDAVAFLVEVLEAMDEHQSKKTAMLRRLHISQIA